MATHTISDFVIAALLFSAIIIGSFSLIAPYVPSGGNQAARFSEYNTSLYGQFDDLNRDVDSMKNITRKGPQTGLFGIIDGTVGAIAGALQSAWSALATFSTAISEVAYIMHLPAWLLNFIIASITAIIAFVVLAIWFKWYI